MSPIGTIGYLLYNVASFAGVLAAGLASSYAPYVCTWTAAAGLVGVSLVLKQGDAHVLLACLGALHAFCSTILSICICSTMAAKTRSYGRLTSLLDGVGSLVAALVQLVPRAYFAPLQAVCA